MANVQTRRRLDRDHDAAHRSILREPTLVVAELRRHWTVAVSTGPPGREAAVEALSAVRRVLSVIPVKEPGASARIGIGRRHREGVRSRLTVGLNRS